MTFGDKIKAQRHRHEITMEELARRVGVSTPTIQRYESGVIANVRRDKISKLADALGCSPSYLMGWTDDPGEYDVSADQASPHANISFLSDDEASLIGTYRQLTPPGQGKVTSYAEYTLHEEKTTPPAPPGKVLAIGKAAPAAPTGRVREDPDGIVLAARRTDGYDDPLSDEDQEMIENLTRSIQERNRK